MIFRPILSGSTIPLWVYDPIIVIFFVTTFSEQLPAADSKHPAHPRDLIPQAEEKLALIHIPGRA
jgi:hypothetical protein